jgi:ABC-type transport system substrate-binding protein
MKAPMRFKISQYLIIAASLILASCAPHQVSTPQEIVKTVVVTQLVEGKPVEVVVTPTAGGEGASTAEHFLLAEEMTPCLPIPEMPSSVSLTQANTSPRIFTDVAPEVSRENTTFDTFSAQEAEKTYRVGVFSDVTSLNVFSANGPDNSVWDSYMLPQRLSMYTLSEKYFTFVPLMAAVQNPPPLHEEENFWVVEIPLRKDITWSDGTILTAKDVAFSANSVMQLGLISGNWQTWYDSNFLDHVEAIDDFTVKYYYHTKPGIARHEYGVLQAPVVSEAYWAPVIEKSLEPIKALPANATDEQKIAASAEAQDILFAHDPVGEPIAGAYLVDKWEPGGFLITEKKDSFFREGLKIEQFENGAYRDSNGVEVGTPEGSPETSYEVGPHAKAVIYTIYGSQDAAILALKNGEVDFVLNPLGLQRGLAQQIQNEPNLTVLDNRVNGYRYLSFNNRRRPMNDCSFRQAVSVLIDKEFVTSVILQNMAFPFYSYVAEGNVAWYYDGIPKLGQGLNRQQRLDLVIAILEQAGYSWENNLKPTYDTEEASVVPGGRLVMPDGIPVPAMDLWAPSPGYDPLRSTFAIWIETWLNEIGIPAKANLAGFNTLLTRIFTEQDFDMYILGRSLSIFPADLHDNFTIEQAVLDGNNAGGYYNPEFEDLADQLLVCDTLEKCKEVAAKLQIMLATECPHVILFDTGIIEAYANEFVEYPYTEQLSGLQYTHQQGFIQPSVKVK